ncbi:SDR family NAD(P)-dependent oxidoreductase [Streptomyces sp. NPDC056529]|uniref:SDR family NAD(P)-dependent oxidoreductase n=1 Tax=Streptomyces sp. NPDC056529 TaxID=3345855 RepID=UPI0036AB0BAF
MNLQIQGPVLITGCSSGIGTAVARAFLDAGAVVYATARRVETLTELAGAGACTLSLDVTDEESMRKAVQAVEADHGSVGVLVNNAGYGEYGTVEEADLELVRKQFDTNVFGAARMIQLVLPGMRRAGRGRIINIGSMGGRLTFPAGGYYHASKYALEALTDALRVEVEPFGVRVVLIEPGLIRTSFGGTAARTLSSNSASPEAASAYTALNRRAQEVMASGYGNKLLSASPEPVARAVLDAAGARRPRHRHVITPAAKALVHLRRLAGSHVFDAVVRSQFRLSRP